MDQIFEFTLDADVYENNNRTKVCVPKSAITGLENNSNNPNSCVVHVGLTTVYYVKATYKVVRQLVYGNDIINVPEAVDEALW